VAKASIADNDSFAISDGTHTKTFAYNRTGPGAAATGSITLPAKAAFTDNDYFIISDGTHTKQFGYQKTANTHATGSITCPLQSALVDHDWFILHDGTHDVAFEYNVTGVASTHTAHLIDVIAAGTAAEVATATYNAIIAQYGAGFAMTATDPTGGAVIALTNDNFGVGVAITNHVADGTFQVSGMTGGSIFVESAGNTSASATMIDISLDTSAIDVAARTYTAIASLHAGGFGVTATDPAGATTIALTNDAVGVLGNVPIDITGVTAAGFSKTGMSNGAALFVESADNTAASAIIINISADTTAVQVAARTYTALAAAHGAGFTVTATDPALGTTIALLNDGPSATGNATITKSTGAAFTVTGMTGGVTILARDDGDVAAPELDSIDADVENVVGSSAGDYIDASGSNLPHVLMGMAGDDTLIGAGLVDYLYGGPGADTLKGNAGDDFLFGGNDSDLLQGGTGNDTINGAGVNCSLVSVAAPIVPYVSAICTSTFSAASTTVVGIDTLDYSDRTVGTQALYVDLSSLNCTGHQMGEVSTSECDVIVATSGVANVRNIRGGAGDDTLKGDSRDNIIWGGAGADNIYGGLGNDALYGEAGNDHIYGNDGLDATIASTAFDNDYINGGSGANFEYGDDGLDTIDSSQGTGDTVVCGKGDGDINLPAGNETSVNADCEL